MPNKMRKSKSANKSVISRTRRGSPDSKKPSIDDYEIEKLIGKGSYALVKLGKEKSTGDYYAIKTYERRKLSDPLKK